MASRKQKLTEGRTAVFFRADQLEGLQKLSQKTGAPVTELVRRAVDEYLKKNG